MKDTHQHARMATIIFGLLLSVAILLLVAFHPDGVVGASSDVPSGTSSASSDTNDAAANVNEYEFKVQQALAHYATKSHRLLGRALQEGGAAASVEIVPDGNVANSGSDSHDELWQAEFALQALEVELKTLDELKKGGVGSGDGDEFFSGDEYYAGDDEEYNSGDDEEYYSGDDDENEEYFDDDYYSGDEYDSGDFGKDMKAYLRKDKSLKAILSAIEDEDYRRDVFEDIRHEAKVKASLDPESWYEYSYWELHAYFSCHRAFAAGRPLYDFEKWADLRQYWNTFRKEDMKELPIPMGKPERTYQFADGAFDPPLTPFQSMDKGRGLKAARDISKGEMVFTATNNTVIFTHGHTWRKFLFAIYERNDEPYDSETTCDALVWSWVQTLEDDGPLVIVADFDNGSLLNEGRDDDGWESPNVRCGKVGDKRCMMSYYATKDIKNGDELLCDYREFALLNAWPDMGL